MKDRQLTDEERARTGTARTYSHYVEYYEAKNWEADNPLPTRNGGRDSGADPSEAMTMDVFGRATMVIFVDNLERFFTEKFGNP